MPNGTYKALSQNEFSVYQASYRGVLLTNAVQGGTPAADGLVTITDRAGNVLGGISAAAASYPSANLFRYVPPATMWTIQPHGGLSGTVLFQLVDHANHATILHTERYLFTPPSVPTGTFKPNSTNTFSLSMGLDADGNPYTTSNTSSMFTILDRETGAVLAGPIGGGDVGGIWMYGIAPVSVFDPNRPVRVYGQYWDLAGTTLLDTEICDSYPSNT